MQIESRVASDRPGAEGSGTVKPGSATPIRMAIHALVWFLGVSGVLIATHASADPLTLIEDGRFVLAEDCSQFGCPGQTAIPPSPFASWVGGVSVAGQSAIQSSSMSQDATEARIEGLLASGPDRPNPVGDAHALSHFFVTFDAAEAASYVLSGNADWSSSDFLSFTAVELRDVTANQYLYNNYDPGPISHSGNLTAGHRYQLLLFTDSTYDSSADLDFDFVVPEPGRLASLANGVVLVAILAARRRRPRSRADRTA